MREPSPDDTSLLGLAAIWTELDAPMPPKRRANHREGRRGRAPAIPLGLLAGLAAAVLLVVAMFVFLLNLIG